MFYSQFILAKKGPLGTIWIAAHLERKLRKNQVTDTDIALSVDSILFPEMPIALRLSSHLLLGVVRIYSRKVNYLFDDCSEALLKVKQAFRSTAVDLPPEKSTAPYHSITMPETFDLDDFELPDNDLQGNYVDQHISSKEQITLQDTMEGVLYSTSKFGLDERFGDDDASGMDLEEDLFMEKAATPDHANASDNLNQDLDEYDGDNEPVDYAEAPSTPGLWEEPTLPNILETSACDDRLEPENHSVTEVSHQHHHNLFESHEKSPPPVAAEQMLINDFGSTPFTESCLAETVIPASNVPAKVANLLNKNVSDVPPGFESAIVNIGKDNAVGTPQLPASLEPKDSTIPDQISHASMASSGFHVLMPCVTLRNHETNAEEPHVIESLNKELPEIHHTEIGKHHEVRVDNVIQKEVQVENITSYNNYLPAPVIEKQVQVETINSYKNYDPAPVIQKEIQVENINSYNNYHHAPVIQKEVQVENINSYNNYHPAPVIQKEVQLENINSYNNYHPAPVIQKEVQVENINSYNSYHPAHVIQKEVQVENINSYNNYHLAPVIQQEVQLENINSYSNYHPAPVVQRDVQVENINSHTNDLSAPEKRLSLPHWLSDVPKTFVPETTPTEKETSGKKRTFTESSMTAQSLNLNESSGLHTTNVTPQSFNLNQSSGLFTANSTAQTLSLNESSGFFTTSTTAQSLNINQSSGGFTVNTSGLSVTDDADLLSSILVGRQSSILKPKPTPVVTPSTKRRRPTPKTDAVKRKVLMDDYMVLHGDIIRQQLTNTDDIQRLRKKAPCTRSEISMLEKQSREDEIFREPVFTGVAIKLASLHRQLYDLSKIVVSHNDASLVSGKDPKTITQKVGKDTHLEVVPNVPAVRDNHTHDNNMLGLDSHESQPPQTVATEHVPEPFSSEHDHIGERNQMEIDPKSFPDADVGVSVMPTEVEPPTYADVVPRDAFDTSAEVEPPTRADVVPHISFDTPAEVGPPTHADVVTRDVFDMSVEVAPPTRADVVPHDTFDTPAEVGPPTHADVVPRDAFDTSAEVEPPTRADVIPRDTFDTSAEAEPPTRADVVQRDTFDTSTDIEPPTHADEIIRNTFDTSAEVEPPNRTAVVLPGTFDMSAATCEVQVDASVQTDPPGVSSSGKIDLQSFDLDINEDKPSENAIASEIKINGDSVREISERKQNQNVEFQENEEVVNEDAAVASHVVSTAQSSVYNGIFGEELGTVGTHDNEINPVSENVLLDERENPGQQVSFEMTEMKVENIPTSNRVDYNEPSHSAVENNTDFLNFDDDDNEADAGGEYVTDMDATRVIDNSGWSTRTKAVTKYLQIMFDKEGGRGRNMLAVNNLLVGKTRKEASRMFFETLVLTTKEFIHVEQADPFGNINIFPRARLLKSDF